MPEPLETIIRRLEALEKEVRRLKVEKPRFTIGNVYQLPQITANQNDYDVGAYDIVRLTSDAAYNITGISGGVRGRQLLIRNSGAFNLTLVHNGAASAAANRIFHVGATNVVLAPGEYTLLDYYTAWTIVFITT